MTCYGFREPIRAGGWFFTADPQIHSESPWYWPVLLGLLVTILVWAILCAIERKK